MKNKQKQKKLKTDKGSANSDISILLWFAGAGLIVLFLLAYLVLKQFI